MPETPEFKGIEDKEGAEEGAYAEKPYRDAAAEYGEKLSPEAKQALEWIASQEGEKAIKRYQEASVSEKDRAVEILKEQALSGAMPPRDLLEKNLREIEPYKPFSPDAMKVAVEEIEVITKRVAEPEIESILKSDKSIPEKQHELTDFGKEFGRIVAGERAPTWLTKMSQRKALFAHGLATGVPARIEGGFEAVKSIGGVSSEEVREATRNYIRQNFPLITDIRSGVLGNKIPTGLIKLREEALDAEMQKFSFLWDKKTKKYIEMK